MSFVALSRSLGWLEPLELLAYDQFLTKRSEMNAASPPVVLIGATDSDFARFGWPLSDDTIADALGYIVAGNARAIGLDIYRDRSIAPGAEKLAQMLKTHSNIVAIFKLSETSGASIKPPAIMADTDRIAVSDILPDKDGIIRRGVLYLSNDTDTYPGLALRLALDYLRTDNIRPTPSPRDPTIMRLGATVLNPLNDTEGGYARFDSAGYQFLMDYRDRTKNIPLYKLGDLIDGRISPSAFQDKVVIVGTTADSIKDYFYAPIDHSTSEGRMTFGIVLHAHAVSQLIRQAKGSASPTQVLDVWQEYLLIFIAGLIASTIGLYVRRFWVLGITVPWVLAAITGACFIGFLYGWWLPLLPISLVWAGSATWVAAYLTRRERNERRLFRQSLSAYLSPAVVEQIVQGRLKPELGGKASDVTVMFADIRGYTTLSENMTPESIIGLLNRYFGCIIDVIHRYHGNVFCFMGDGIMVVFGAPNPLEKSCDMACIAGVQMLYAVEKLNADLQREGAKPIQIGIGLHYGSAVVGHVGALNRNEYTVIGDVTNVASRLEGVTKEVGCDLVCSDAVVAQLSLEFREKLQPIGSVTIKGHSPVVVFGYSHRR